LTNSGTVVSNGLFAVTLDFGPGVFTGTNFWMEIGVSTNGGGSFTTLAPRQQLLPTPYAIFANTSSNLSGTLSAGQLSGPVNNNQLANSSLTVSAGTGLSGGGAVALGGSTTLNNAGVTSLTGNADITASPASGAVTLGDTATSANTASRIVKRDGSGNFSAQSVTLGGNLNLPATTASAGIIFSGGNTLLHTFGTDNTFAGVSAGNLTMSAGGNTGIGFEALQHETTGGLNTAIGQEALNNNTTGSANVAVGYFALWLNTNGINNTAAGFQALVDNTSGNGNTASGAYTLQNNTTGDENTASGSQALYSNTNGGQNAAFGFYAMEANTSGSLNTACGAFALEENTTGQDNTASGYSALEWNTSGYNNTATGDAALNENTSGIYNTADGVQALENNTNGQYNTAEGYYTMQANTSGAFNTADGANALQANTTGSYNVARGYLAGSGITTGSYNIDIGNPGMSGDANVIRIGTSQTSTYIATDLQLSGGASYHNFSLSGGNALGYLYGSYPALGDGIHLGYNYYYDANGTGHVFNTGGGTSRISVGYGTIDLAVGGSDSAPSTVMLHVTTSGVCANGTVSDCSDRNAKQDMAPVDPAQILERALELPLSKWSYKIDAATRHIGPMAQDFYAAFDVGSDDKHIATIDEGGVALAAIQGLNEKLEGRSQKAEAGIQNAEARIQKLEGENAELKGRLERLEQIILKLNSTRNPDQNS